MMAAEFVTKIST